MRHVVDLWLEGRPTLDRRRLVLRDRGQVGSDLGANSRQGFSPRIRRRQDLSRADR